MNEKRLESRVNINSYEDNIIERTSKKINGLSKIKEVFLFLLRNFPNDDYEIFQTQLTLFNTTLQSIYSTNSILSDFQLKSISFIRETDFSSIIYALIMNQTLNTISKIKVLNIFSLLTKPIFSPESMTFIEDEDFINQLLIYLHAEGENIKIRYSCFQCILNIAQFYPNSIQFLHTSGITDYITEELIKSSDFETLSLTYQYILKIIETTDDQEIKDYLLSQSILGFDKLIEKEMYKPLTYALQNILTCIKTQPDVRINLVIEQNICAKCVDIILKMKEKTSISQFFSDYCIQILSCISNEGSEQEFQILLDSDVFEAFFVKFYSFLDISFDIKIDPDSFDYVCDFLIGIINRNNNQSNQLLCQYEIFQQISYVLFKGPTPKKLSSLFVISKAVELRNNEMLQLFLSDESLELIFDMLSTMSSQLLQKTLHILIRVLELYPETKEKYACNDIVSKLESFLLKNDCEEIKEVRILLDYVQDSE